MTLATGILEAECDMKSKYLHSPLSVMPSLVIMSFSPESKYPICHWDETGPEAIQCGKGRGLGVLTAFKTDFFPPVFYCELSQTVWVTITNDVDGWLKHKHFISYNYGV